MDPRVKPLIGPWRKPRLFVFLWGLTLFTPGFSQTPPLWQFVPPGRILGLPVPTPEGDWGFLCEDKFFYLLNDQGQIKARWSSGGRFVPLLSRQPQGQWSIQTWDHTLWVLSPELVPIFHIKLTSPLMGPMTTDPKGDYLLALKEGLVLNVNSTGKILWEKNVGSPITTFPVLDAGGEFWISTAEGNLQALDPWGETLVKIKAPTLVQHLAFSPVTGLLMTGAGGRISWLDDQGEEFRIQVFSGQSIRQILVEPTGRVWVVTTNKLRILSSQSRLEKEITLESPVSGSGVLTEKRTLILPLKNGQVVEWDGKGGKPQVLYQDSKTLGPLGLSEKGILVVSGESWIFTALQVSPPPGFGWTGLYGNSQGRSDIQRDVSVRNLDKPYLQIPEYQYFKALVQRGDYNSHSQVIQDMEELESQGKLWSKWNFASLILLSVAQAGVSEPEFLELAVVNNFPDLRKRALRLLGGAHDPRIRKIVAGNLLQEYDPQALIGGIQVLGEIGFDGDGNSLRTIYELIKTTKDEATASAALGALKNILRMNGRLTDPAGLMILTRLFQGPFSANLRRDAQKTFQLIIAQPSINTF